MKKLMLIIGFLFVSLFTFAQYDDGRSMKPIISDMKPVIDTVESRGWEVVKLEYDIVSTDSKITYRILTTSWVYRIGVVGDYRTEDMDLEIYKQKSDGTYEFVAQDQKAPANFVYIDVQPTEITWYKFVVRCVKFKPGYTSCHYGLIIFHK